jgi:hypothetical protein
MQTNATGNAQAVREKLGLLYDPELAEVLGITVPTLRNRRLLGQLPPSSKVGAIHITLVADLKAWLARRQRQRGAR